MREGHRKNAEKDVQDGEFSDNTCGTPAAAGKYKLAAWNEGKDKFRLTGKGGKSVIFEYLPSSQTIVGAWECANEQIIGKSTGPKTAEFTTTYGNCKTNEGKNCNTTGQGKGTIVTQLPEGTLIAQPGSKEGVGELVTPKTGSVLAAYECEGLTFTRNGAIIGEIIGATKVANKSFTFTFAKGPGAFQKFGFLGENEAENFESFKAFFEGAGPAPSAPVFSTVFGPEIPGGELTLPVTLQNAATIKTEAFKIV